MNYCDLLMFGPAAVCGLAAVYFSVELQRHVKAGPVWFLEAWRKDSYTPEGQRWLKRMKIALPCVPLSLIVSLAASVALCPERAAQGEQIPPRTPALGLYVAPSGPLWWAAIAYWLVGAFLLARLVRHGKDGRSPSVPIVLKSSSYSDEGRRWLFRFRIWLLGNLLFWWVAFLLR